MLEGQKEFILLIQTTRNIRKLTKTREENWTDLWPQPCRAREINLASRKWLRYPKSGSEKKCKTRYDCIVELYESTRQRAESLRSQIREYRTNGKGFTSMTHYNLVRKFFPMPQAMMIPDAKAAVDKEWKKLETIPARNLDKVKSKKELILQTQRENRKVNFASLMDMCHLKKWWVGTQITEVQKQSRAPGGHCERRLWSLRSFNWTRLICVPDDCCKNHGRYCKITRLWWTSSWRSICQYSGKIGRCSKIAQNSKIRMSRYLRRIPRHKWPKSWATIEELVIPLERNLYGHPSVGLLWERQVEEENLDGKESQFGNVCSLIGNKGYFCQCMWTNSTWLTKCRNWLPCGRRWWKMWTLMNRHHFLTTFHWCAFNAKAHRLNILRRCLNHVFLLELSKNYWDGRNLTHRHQHGPRKWRDMLKNALGDTVNWQTRKWSNFKKFRISV